ncbi:prepilin peptidase CpaA [Pacificibacter maritimus]|uniref:Prepilin peptidase CpaA n=1 Tax=Pacificibacter maritimus TaxID=762213 RepID=A0A3N4UZR1_9RHOB|nr:prepilin peptidase [Pacificibacter maritimus]RPE67080.1 prepilin peptidase CpaA [Pacificibacter maritimus]
MLTLEPTAAIWLLIVTTPLCFLAAFNDLARMKLPNAIAIAVVGLYIIIGPFLFSFDMYLWGFSHGAIMYFLGMFAFMFMGVGAGDGKFAAAMAMFIPAADARFVVPLFCAFVLGAFVTHRIFRALPIVRRATSDWVSWDDKKFPVGLALAGTFVAYFGIVAFSS